MLSANQIAGFIKIQYLTKEVNDEVYFWQADKHRSLLEVDTSILGLCQKYPKNNQSTQNNKFAISLQYLQKEVNDELIVCMEISIEACYMILWFWSSWSSIPKVVKIATFKCLYNISKKKLQIILNFCFRWTMELISILWASKFPTRQYCYYWWAWSRIPKVTNLQYLYNISKKKLGREFIFCMEINIKVSAS